MRGAVISGLDPATYRPHPLHTDTAAAWPETNCYADLWIEVLNALRLDPVALLPFCLAVDFDGDQWTFFKPSLDDIWSLYGIDVQELNIWESLDKHVREQVQRGNLPLVEVDSFYLPDTAGTAYQVEHTKTTIGINDVDFEAESLGYFHNGSYYALQGDGFRQLLRVGDIVGNESLMPYAEFAKLDRRFAMGPEMLRKTSQNIARRHLQRSPSQNPFPAYRLRFGRDLERLLNEPVGFYHKYAFATLRQFGASFQLSAVYLRWLEEIGPAGMQDAIRAFDTISESAKTLLFKMARSVNTRKPLQYESLLDTMETNWQIAFDTLDQHWGSK